jgi:hypothetical protein
MEVKSMKPRAGMAIFWGLLTLAVAGVVAFFAYHAGLAQTPVPVTGDVPAHDYYYPGGWGFGGFFSLLFFVLLLSFLFRAARWRRHYWGGHWGHGHWNGGMPGGPGDPSSWGAGSVPPQVESRLRAWHDSAHGTPAAPGSPTGTPPGNPG